MEALELDEHGNWEGCPNKAICYYPCNPSCPQYPVKVGRSQVGELHVVKKLGKNLTHEEVLVLWREGKLWHRTDNVRKCAVCDKTITSGYVWDNTDTFCSKGCVAKALADDPDCVEILLDAGRIEWQENFSKAKGL